MKNRDSILFSALKKGNEKAFTLLYNKYWEKLYFVAYLHTQSVQESEDLIHEIFIELWKNRKNINIRNSVSTYIFTALKYKTFRLYDARTVREKYATRVQNENLQLINSTESELSFNELFHLIEQEVEKLPDKCKLVFRMRQTKTY